jgi:hypothetical protein
MPKLPSNRCLAATAMAAAALVVVSIALVATQNNASAQPKSPAATSLASLVAPQTDSKDGLSAATLASFKRYGTEFTAMDPSKGEARVDQDEAYKTATGSLSFTRSAHKVEVAYGLLTVPTYGKQLEEDATKPSLIDPPIKDRPVWLFVFRGVPVPVFGPHTSTEFDAKQPVSMNGNVWIAVDANSGEALGGETAQ